MAVGVKIKREKGWRKMAEKETKNKQLTSGSSAPKRKKASEGDVKYKQKEQFEGSEGDKGKRTRNASGAGKKSSGGTSRTKKEPVKVFEENPRSRRMVHQLMPYVLMALALFTVVCFLLIDVFTGADATKGVGSVGKWIRDVFCGLFGFGAFFVPVALALLSVGWRRAVEKNALLAKVLYAVFSVIMIATFLHVIIRLNHPVWVEGSAFKSALKGLWGLGILLDGGGVIGGFFGELLYRWIGLVGAILVTIIPAVILIIFLCGVTPSYVMTVIRYKYKIWREKRAEVAKIRREERAEAAEEARVERENKRAEEEEKRMLAAAEREAKKEQLGGV